MCFLHHSLPSSYLLVAAAAFVVTSPPVRAADDWVRVAAEGIDSIEQRGVDDLAIHGGRVYVATRRSLPGGVSNAYLYRARLRDDTTWEGIPLPFQEHAGSAVLASIGDRLYVGSASGEIYYLTTDDVWMPFAHPYFGEVLDIVEGPPRPGEVPAIAVACKQGDVLAVYSFTPGDGRFGFERTDLEPRLDHAVIAYHEGALFVGVGGESAGSRSCGLRMYEPSGSDVHVSADCFGMPGLTWIYGAVSFRGALYFGTGGHHDRPSLVRLRGAPSGTTHEVVYREAEGYSIDPSTRVSALAVAAGRLFIAGGSASGPSPVKKSVDGRTWVESGFLSSLGNQTIARMAGRESHLYAGVVNTSHGFEIWRRTPSLSEVLSFYDEDWAEIRDESIAVDLCADVPCHRLFVDAVSARVEARAMAFETCAPGSYPLERDLAIRQMKDAKRDLYFARQAIQQASQSQSAAQRSALLKSARGHVATMLGRFRTLQCALTDVR